MTFETNLCGKSRAVQTSKKTVQQAEAVDEAASRAAGGFRPSSAKTGRSAFCNHHKVKLIIQAYADQISHHSILPLLPLPTNTVAKGISEHLALVLHQLIAFPPTFTQQTILTAPFVAHVEAPFRRRHRCATLTKMHCVGDVSDHDDAPRSAPTVDVDRCGHGPCLGPCLGRDRGISSVDVGLDFDCGCAIAIPFLFSATSPPKTCRTSR